MTADIPQPHPDPGLGRLDPADRVGVDLTVDAAELARALDDLKPAVPARPRVEGLRGVLIEAHDDTLTLTGTDEEITMRVTIPATVVRPGTVLIRFHPLHKIAGKPAGARGPDRRRAPDRARNSAGNPGRRQRTPTPTAPAAPSIRLTSILEPDGTPSVFHVEVDQAKVRHELRPLPLADFPAIPATDAALVTRLAGTHLTAAAVRVAPFASNDQGRPVLTAVCLAAGRRTLTFAATDSYRLAVLDVPHIWTAGKQQAHRRLSLSGTDKGSRAGQQSGPKTGSGGATLPGLLVPKTALDLAAALLGSQPTVEIAIDEPQQRVSFAASNDKSRELSVKLVEGEFPPFRRLMPSIEDCHRATLRRADLLAVLNHMAATLGRSTRVRLTLDPAAVGTAHSGVTVECHHHDIGRATGRVGLIDYTGPPAEIAFNVDYLRAALNAVGGAQVQFHFHDVRKPVILTAAPTSAAAKKPGGPVSFTALLMPLK